MLRRKSKLFAHAHAHIQTDKMHACMYSHLSPNDDVLIPCSTKNFAQFRIDLGLQVPWIVINMAIRLGIRMYDCVCVSSWTLPYAGAVESEQHTKSQNTIYIHICVCMCVRAHITYIHARYIYANIYMYIARRATAHGPWSRITQHTKT
jgi:hypothetical protein